jgi:hypothetical protein
VAKSGQMDKWAKQQVTVAPMPTAADIARAKKLAGSKGFLSSRIGGALLRSYGLSSTAKK